MDLRNLRLNHVVQQRRNVHLERRQQHGRGVDKILVVAVLDKRWQVIYQLLIDELTLCITLRDLAEDIENTYLVFNRGLLNVNVELLRPLLEQLVTHAHAQLVNDRHHELLVVELLVLVLVIFS